MEKNGNEKKMEPMKQKEYGEKVVFIGSSPIILKRKNQVSRSL